MCKVTILLLCGFLFPQTICLNAQPLKKSLLHDSLPNLLGYFYENTNDTHFKQAIKKAEVLCKKDTVTDSLAHQLLYTENLLIHLIEDSSLLNLQPFEKKRIAFGEIVLKQFQSLPDYKENILYAAALHNLGCLHEEKWYHTPDDDKQTLALFEKAFEIRKKISQKSSIEYAESLSRIGEMYNRSGENEKGRLLVLQALAIRKKAAGEENADYADNLFSLAILCREAKKYDTAMLLYEQEINIRKKIEGEESPHFALRLYYTAEMMNYLWAYRKALAYYRQALNITEKTIGEENIQYAYCLEGVAGYYYDAAEYKQAIALYLQSLAIKEKLLGNEYKDNALTLHNLATTYIKMGKYEEAIPCLQRVITIQKKTNQLSTVYAYDLNWQGLLYYGIGNYSKALSLYQQALSIKGYMASESRYAATLNNIAALYEYLGENKQALSYLERARLIIKNALGKQSPDYANVLLNLSVLNEKLYRYKTAMQLCREALLIRRNFYGAMHPQYAVALTELGKIYMQTGKPDSSELCFMQALSIQKSTLGEEHADYINSLNSLTLLQAMQGKKNDAAFTIIKANRLQLKYIARIYTSLSEHEKMDLEKNQYYQFSYLPSLIYKYNIMQPQVLQQLYANELTLKGNVLNNQQNVLNSVRKNNNKYVVDLYNEWRANKIFIGKELLLPVKERSNSLDSVKEVSNQFEQQLSRISAVFQWQQEIITAKNISEKLLSGQAAIEFIKFQYYNKKFTDSILYAALIVLPGDSVPKFAPLFEEKQLVHLLNREGKNENSINKFYLASNDNKLFPCSGNALFNLIWAPLEKYLAGISTIYYSPVGLLHRIAFKALPVDTSYFLIDKYQLNQMLSTRSVMLYPVTQNKPSSINICSNIEYNQKSNAGKQIYRAAEKSTDTNIYNRAYKWAALDNTRLELDSIKNIFTNAGIHAFAVTGTNATEEAFKAMDGKSPQVLHIATHGFFWSTKDKLNNNFIVQQDAMFRSGIVLAGANNIWNNKKLNTEDGILTSYEIAGMDLSNTDLIVLSACETALGDLEGNEGVIGLQRALKLAGVKQMIISLWRVPDKQTSELMGLFYANWLSGKTPHDALRASQLIMKAKYPPYNWAGFVLVE